MADESAAPAQKRRLFLAVLPDDPARDALVQRQEALAGCLGRPRATARYNLHLTLAFLGMCDEAQERAATEALAAAAGVTRPFRLTLGDVGTFSRRRGRASVVWCGIAEDAGARALRGMQARLEAGLRERGIALEERPFRPHMTLFRQARVPERELLGQPLASAMRPTGFPVTSASLMWSHHPDPGGPLVYTELVRVPLGGAVAATRGGTHARGKA